MSYQHARGMSSWLQGPGETAAGQMPPWPGGWGDCWRCHALHYAGKLATTRMWHQQATWSWSTPISSCLVHNKLQ